MKDEKEEHGQVEIKINKDKYLTHIGNNPVAHLRSLGKIPDDEILSQFINGEFVPLDNKAHVDIHGGEIFVSSPESAGSS